jgi:carbon storage regulator
MLVLTRKAGERIHIGTDITLTVLEIQGNRVRIGIEAPPRVALRRGELRPSAPPAASEPPAQEEAPAAQGRAAG